MGEGHWSDPTLVAEEMNRAGYELLSEFDFLPVQSFQIFGGERPEKLGRSSPTNAPDESQAGS